ncbi:MAG TPA: SDR family NAD(P)-dependent oxidoreductase, partial [Gammaproteobacteria bacterium]|nr:SDR family NAD(P)-dependent oxidoreductase [Gammaproteobacteria bacterium]
MRIPQNESHWAEVGVALDGKTALVTGATDGLGKEVARQLAALGAFVIVHGRDAQRGAQVVDAIRAQGKGGAVFRQADFGSLAEVRSFADWAAARPGGLDLLINNAAATVGERRMSADGFELAFAVNHLAHFLLSQLLLPALEANAPARIVNVSSL